ncbi:MAG TPA: hypothetical protein ENM97_00755, partial [Moorella mulderi]|nr:hypothetical protein [Moorella mulderi]
MRKVRNRWLSIALAVIVGLALVLPLAPQQAQAASTYQMSYVARVKAPYSGEIGTLIISMDGISASEAKDSEVVLSLPSSPSGYKLVVDQAKIKGTNYFGRGAKFEVQQISDTTVKLKVNAVSKKGDPDKTSLISIPLEVTIPSGVSGDVILTIEAPDKSQFSRGSIVIARVVPAKVELAVESVPVIGSAGGKIGVIELKETVAKALYESPVTLSLPSGFKWADKNLNKLEDTTYSGKEYATVVWGDKTLKERLEFEVKNDARDLKISDKSDQGTEEAAFLKLQLYVLPIE